MRAAVVGHVEWLEFVPVEAVPGPGEIVHASESWEQAAGGGSVAAVQLSKLADSIDFFTVLGNDEHGRRAREELEARGITVHASTIEAPQRSGFTLVDDAGERTIVTIGRKLHPRGHDEGLPWHELARCDAVYFCAGDADALLMARRARVLVATARELSTLRQGSVELDALVSSGKDDAERYQTGQLDPEPRLVVTTSGALGGWAQPGGPYTAAPLPPEPADAYGAGDCFAAGLAFALGSGLGRAPGARLRGALRRRCRWQDRAFTRRWCGCRKGCGSQGLRCGGKWSKVGLRGRETTAEPMFYGTHEHTIDDKNRLTLPAKFRDGLGGDVVLVRGIDRTVDVYPRKSWESSVERITDLDSLTREAREMKRFVFSGATVAEVDKQGRVLVPPDLASHAGLGKDVAVVGVHDHIEIWGRPEWAAHVSAIEGSVGDVAERAADRRG